MAINDPFEKSPVPPRQFTLDELRPRYFKLGARYGNQLWTHPEGIELRQHLDREDLAIVDKEFVFATPATIAMYWDLLDYLECKRRNFLIVGERGAGKEVLAQLIARHRKTENLVSVNCASLVESIADGLLFGFGKKSGIANAPPAGSLGFVGQADGGVLFLDEFFDAPSTIYPKLLRLLQPQREYWPLGASKCLSLRPETIIVAASNRYPRLRDVRAAMAGANVRADLLDRFDAMLEVPPLRERAKEIGKIADLLVGGLHPDLPFRALTESTKLHLRHLNHTWPGNVRDLKTFLYEQARLLRSSAKTDELDIPQEAICSWFSSFPSPISVSETCLAKDGKGPGRALPLWDKEQLREKQRAELVLHLVYLMHEQGRSQVDAFRMVTSPAAV